MLTLHPVLFVKVQAILHAVCDAQCVHISEITGPRRTARIAAARQLAMTVVRATTNLSLMEIGDIFNRDHGTVIHALKRVANDDALTAKAKELTPRPERPQVLRGQALDGRSRNPHPPALRQRRQGRNDRR